MKSELCSTLSRLADETTPTQGTTRLAAIATVVLTGVRRNR